MKFHVKMREMGSIIAVQKLFIYSFGGWIKMKKILSAILVLTLLVTMSFAAFAGDENLNNNEKAMLEWAKVEYETAQAGVYVKLPESLVAAATNYLMVDGIDITEAQFTEAETHLNALKAYLKENLVVEDGVTTLEIKDVSQEIYDGILAIYKDFAEAIDASIIITNDRYVTGKIVVQSNTVKDAVLVVDEGVETSFGVNVTMVVISCAAVVIVIAAVAFVLTKKKEKVNA